MLPNLQVPRLVEMALAVYDCVGEDFNPKLYHRFHVSHGDELQLALVIQWLVCNEPYSPNATSFPRFNYRAFTTEFTTVFNTFGYNIGCYLLLAFLRAGELHYDESHTLTLKF